jgi:hypothetical protein
MPLLRLTFLFAILVFVNSVSSPFTIAEAKDRDSQQQHQGKTPNKLPELMPKKPECGLFLPARDERHDLARLVRSEQFLECERDGFPKELAPPWKTSEEGTKKLSDACEYFAGESARNYPQVGEENIKLAADRCRVEVIEIILMLMTQGLGH